MAKEGRETDLLAVVFEESDAAVQLHLVPAKVFTRLISLLDHVSTRHRL